MHHTSNWIKPKALMIILAFFFSNISRLWYSNCKVYTSSDAATTAVEREVCRNHRISLPSNCNLFQFFMYCSSEWPYSRVVSRSKETPRHFGTRTWCYLSMLAALQGWFRACPRRRWSKSVITSVFYSRHVSGILRRPAKAIFGNSMQCKSWLA